MLSPEDNKPFVVLLAKNRTKESSPVDNWSAGGLSAHIDITTGVLSKVFHLKMEF